MVAARIRDFYDEEAKERQKSSGGDRKSLKGKSVPAILPEPKKGDSRDQAGKAVNVSGKLVDAAGKVRRFPGSRVLAGL